MQNHASCSIVTLIRPCFQLLPEKINFPAQMKMTVLDKLPLSLLLQNCTVKSVLLLLVFDRIKELRELLFL